MPKEKYLYTDGRQERKLSEIKQEAKQNGYTITRMDSTGKVIEIQDMFLNTVNVFRRSRKWNVRIV